MDSGRWPCHPREFWTTFKRVSKLQLEDALVLEAPLRRPGPQQSFAEMRLSANGAIHTSLGLRPRIPFGK